MVNIFDALKWRILGSYDPNGPVTENILNRAQNRAKYEVWRYNTFGPGREIYQRELAYSIIDSLELSKEPLYIQDPWILAGLASIIAEMEGNKFISMMSPLGTIMTRAFVEDQECEAIDKIANYYNFDKSFLKENIEKLKKNAKK